MDSIQRVSIPSSQNKKLSAVINYPDKVSDRLAILCPGHLDSKDYLHLRHLAQALSEKGYTVVRFDPTGTWESEGDISEYTVTEYLKDIESVYTDMLKKYPYTHLLLGGHSHGGMVSLLYASRFPYVSQVVAIMPSSPYSMTEEKRKEWKEKGVKISTRDLPDGIGERQFIVPYSQVEDRDRYNVIDDVRKIKISVLFLAGKFDEVIPPKDVERIVNNKPEPKKYIILKGIGHDYRHSQAEVEEVNKVIIENI